MKTIMKLLLIPPLALSGLFGAKAQMGFTSCGFNAVGSNGSVSTSIGQVAFANFSSSSGYVTQGLQQPYELFGPNGLSQTARESNFAISLFPNPANESVVLLTSGMGNMSLQFELINIHGQTLQTGIITQAQTRIDLSEFTGTLFFIRVTNESNESTTFKLLKLNTL